MRNILTFALSALVHDLSLTVSALDVSCQCSCPAQNADITRKCPDASQAKRTVWDERTKFKSKNNKGVPNYIILLVNNCGKKVQILFYLAGHL